MSLLRFFLLLLLPRPAQLYLAAGAAPQKPQLASSSSVLRSGEGGRERGNGGQSRSGFSATGRMFVGVHESGKSQNFRAYAWTLNWWLNDLVSAIHRILSASWSGRRFLSRLAPAQTNLFIFIQNSKVGKGVEYLRCSYISISIWMPKRGKVDSEKSLLPW